MDWYGTDGDVALGLGVPEMHEQVEGLLGQSDGQYTSPLGGPAVTVPGVIQSNRQGVNEDLEFYGSIDADQRYQVRRKNFSVADFPANPSGNGFGTLVVAGQTHTVVGVGHGRASFVLLFLSEPIVS